MIDHLDKQTQPMDLEQKRGRGRPATGKALSNADRQRAYRERQKAQRNEKGAGPEWEDVRKLTRYIDDLSEQLAEAINKNRAAEDKAEECRLIAVELGERCERAEQRVKELQKELASRNEKDLTDGKFPGTWVVERKERGAKNWKKSGGVTESSWDAAKGSVDYMQFTSGTGQDNNWRARCTHGAFKGMIYWPKAPK